MNSKWLAIATKKVARVAVLQLFLHPFFGLSFEADKNDPKTQAETRDLLYRQYDVSESPKSNVTGVTRQEVFTLPIMKNHVLKLSQVKKGCYD